MNTLTVNHLPEVMWALQQDAAEFENEARLLLALKLYETGKLSTGLAAQMAGVPRVAFFYLLGQHGLSPFGETPEDLEEDVRHAQQAARRAGNSE